MLLDVGDSGTADFVSSHSRGPSSTLSPLSLNANCIHIHRYIYIYMNNIYIYYACIYVYIDLQGRSTGIRRLHTHTAICCKPVPPMLLKALSVKESPEKCLAVDSRGRARQNPRPVTAMS